MRNIKYLFVMLAVSLPAYSQQADPIGQLSAAGGRYVFGQISSFRRDQYLLDTATGRMWRIACIKSNEEKKTCEFSAFEPIDFLDATGKLAGTAPAPTPR